MISSDDVRQHFYQWQPQARLTKITELTPDASTRRYFRLAMAEPLRNLGVTSVVAMVFDSLAQPESGGATVDPNVACVQLGRLLREHGYPVAEIYYGAETDLIFFIEDLGEQHLVDLLIDHQGKIVRRDKNLILKLYQQGIDCLTCLQAIPVNHEFFAFQRKFAQSAYDSELREVIDFYLRPKVSDSGLEAALGESFSLIVKELTRFPLALAHRDYHSWNLMVDADNRLRIIDYQDALMAPRTYDLVPLLNDRDTNIYLGDELYYELFNYAFDLNNKSSDFLHEYTHVLLQRDLKIVGRFNKLATLRGLRHYLNWVPGALFTLGRLLSFMVEEQSIGDYRELLAILRRLSSEADEGARKPLRLIK